MNKLKKQLSVHGTPLVVKKGMVFTVLITGSNLASFNRVSSITEIVLRHARAEFPMLEVLVNDNNFLLMILKPEQ